MDKLIELKPCPFCGSKANFIKRHIVNGCDQPEAFDVVCEELDCHMGDGADYYFTSKDVAAESWNKRI